MENFSQLLNRYVQRLGVSDTELGRTIGVSRQTIFRWREGLTSRPRHREDVLAIAKKLRLTPGERDRLLLAAGFRPEEVEQESRDTEEQKSEGREQEERPGEELSKPEISAPPGIPLHTESPLTPAREEGGGASPEPITRRRPFPRLLLIIGSLVLLIAATVLAVNNWGYATVTPPAVTAVPTSTTQTNFLPSNTAIPTPANKTTILVTHFANYASSQVGYNVAGRLVEALQREVDDIRLDDIQIVIWPDPVEERDLALQAGQAVSASLVIYGQYDVGRVVVEFAYPADQSKFTAPALQQQVFSLRELSVTINSDLPQQVRSLALLALGQIYLNRSEADQARPLLAQARNNLQNDPAVDQKTWALANFYLGIAYHHSDPPYLDEAIAAYSQAIQAWPQMISSRLNRIAAYETRNQAGDLQLALADADTVVAAKPDWAAAYNNRGAIRMNLGGTENLALALADLEKALALAPDLPEAYLNRAQVQFEQGLSIEEVAPDLEKALDLRPDYGSALNIFCWGHALEQQPEQALAYCQQAIKIDPQPIFLDSRGLVYALLGDYPAAIADFQAYTAWLEQQPGDERQHALTRRQVWIDKLKAGENPFTPTVLSELRHEFRQ